MAVFTIDLSDQHLDVVRSILREYAPNLKRYVFGSRVTGKAKTFSDLDLALCDPAGKLVPMEQIWALRGAFSESNLPITVDVVDFHAASPEFQKLIKQEWIQI